MSPSPQLRDLERHGYGTAALPVSLSRPQKRRRRADRRAVRDALVATSSLKSALDIASAGEYANAKVDDQSQMSALVVKMDQLLHMMATLVCHFSDGVCDAGSAFVMEQVDDVLQYLNPAAPEFIPTGACMQQLHKKAERITSTGSQGDGEHCVRPPAAGPCDPLSPGGGPGASGGAESDVDTSAPYLIWTPSREQLFKDGSPLFLEVQAEAASFVQEQFRGRRARCNSADAVLEEKQVVHFTANVRRAELYDCGKTLVMYAGADDAAPCSILDLPLALLPAALQEAREKQIRIKSYFDTVCPPTLKEKFEKKQDSDPDWLFLQQQLETLLGAMRGPVSTMEPVIDNREEVLDELVQTGMEAMLSSVKSDGAKQTIHRCLGRLRFTLRRHMDDMMP